MTATHLRTTTSLGSLLSQTTGSRSTAPAAPEPLPSPVRIPLFEQLDAHRGALCHAKDVLDWSLHDETVHEDWRQLAALNEIDAGDPPETGPCPTMDDKLNRPEQSLAAHLAAAEIAAEIAQGRDPYATVARTGRSRRTLADGPAELQAALRLAEAFGDGAGLIRRMAPGAVVVVKVGEAALVEPVAALLQGGMADLAGFRPKDDSPALYFLADCPVRRADADDLEDDPSPEGQACRAYRDTLAAALGDTDLHVLPAHLARALRLGGDALLPDAGTVSRQRPAVVAITAADLRGSYEVPRKGEVIARVLEQEAPVLLVVASRDDLPSTVRDLEIEVVALPALNAELLLRHLQISHSATGLVAEDAIRACLPNAAELAATTLNHLTLALRHPTSLAVAAALARARWPKWKGAQAPTLATLPLPHALQEDLGEVVDAFRAWGKGEAPWSTVDSGILLMGPPGTGKTMLAAALAASMGVPLIESSYARWQSEGHLGDYLRAVRGDFARAAAMKGGAVLLIDEVDAFGRRSARNEHGADYSRKVISCLLEALDGVTSREGVVVIGATNFPEVIDPALVRPGRLGRRIQVPGPSTEELPAVLRFHLRSELPELGGTSELPPSLAMRQLAQAASGLTPAEVMEVVRQARKLSRRAERSLAAADLLAALRERRPALPQALRHRAAVHEAGHAVAHAVLGLARPQALRLTTEGGQAMFAPGTPPQTAQEHHRELVALLAGRAAERLLIGSISSGAGGEAVSDLARATRLALAMETAYGLGADGPLWSRLDLDPALAFRADPDLKLRIRARLETAELEAVALLTRHLPVLDALAQRLLADDLLEGRELHQMLAPCRGGAADLDVRLQSEQLLPVTQDLVTFG